MVCPFHGNWGRRRRACPAGCAIGGDIFTDEVPFRQLYEKFGSSGAFYNLFVDRTVAERPQVARALHWETEMWNAEPGGPLLAVNRIEALIHNMELQGYVRDRNFQYIPPDIVVPFGPSNNDRSSSCLYHQKKRTRCDGCILNPVFPCYSNRATFNPIYDKFGISETLPGFFDAAYDLQTRQSVGASLIWEAQTWLDDPVHGPRGVYLRHLETLASLYLPTLDHLVGHDDEDENGVNLRISIGIGGLEEDAGFVGAEQEEPEDAISLAHLIDDDEENAWLKIGFGG